MHLQSLVLLRLTVKEMHLKKTTTVFDLDLGIMVAQDFVQYPLHHATYAHTMFEVATSNGLGGDAFTKKKIYLTLTLGQGHTKCSPVPSTSCDLCTCIV